MCCNPGRKGSNRQEIGREVTPADTADTAASGDQIRENRKSLEILIEKYEDSDRGTWQNPDLVLAKMGDLEGKTVADLGSGTGYFTFRIALRATKVIALDIEQRFLDYIEDRKLDLPPSVAKKIETRHTAEDKPNLQPGEVDVVFMVNVYYYLDNRIEYMKKVKTALKPGGLLVLVDFKPGEMAVGPVDDKVPLDRVISDLRKAGFSILEADNSSLQYQYIVSAK
jgi:SAM-dependent methyltransferase